MESMKVNGVWTVVDPLEGVIPIECKWISNRTRVAQMRRYRPKKLVWLPKDIVNIMVLTITRYFSPVVMLNILEFTGSFIFSSKRRLGHLSKKIRLTDRQ